MLLRDTSLNFPVASYAPFLVLHAHRKILVRDSLFKCTFLKFYFSFTDVFFCVFEYQKEDESKFCMINLILLGKFYIHRCKFSKSRPKKIMALKTVLVYIFFFFLIDHTPYLTRSVSVTEVKMFTIRPLYDLPHFKEI